MHHCLRNLFLALLVCQEYGIVQGAESFVASVDGEERLCGPSGHCNDATTTPPDLLASLLSAIPCKDLRPYCAERKDTCQSNWKFMHPHCPETCQVCHNMTRTTTTTIDDAPRSTENQGALPREARRIIMDVAAADLGVPQLLDPYGTGERRDEIADAIEEARDYLHDVVLEEKRYEKVRALCTNKKPHCALFAVSDDND